MRVESKTTESLTRRNGPVAVMKMIGDLTGGTTLSLEHSPGAPTG